MTNLESLITSIIALGTTYNPSRDSIKLAALQTLLDESKKSLNTVNIAQVAYSNAVAARKVAFQPFSQLITRIYNSPADAVLRTVTRQRGNYLNLDLADEPDKDRYAKNLI
jgi:hypothetical protein